MSQNTDLCVLGGGVTSSSARSLVLDNPMTHDGEPILELERAGILSHGPSYTCIALFQLLAWSHSDSVSVSDGAGEPAASSPLCDPTDVAVHGEPWDVRVWGCRGQGQGGKGSGKVEM